MKWIAFMVLAAWSAELVAGEGCDFNSLSVEEDLSTLRDILACSSSELSSVLTITSDETPQEETQESEDCSDVQVLPSLSVLANLGSSCEIIAARENCQIAPEVLAQLCPVSCNLGCSCHSPITLEGAIQKALEFSEQSEEEEADSAEESTSFRKFMTMENVQKGLRIAMITFSSITTLFVVKDVKDNIQESQQVSPFASEESRIRAEFEEEFELERKRLHRLMKEIIAKKKRKYRAQLLAMQKDKVSVGTWTGWHDEDEGPREKPLPPLRRWPEYEITNKGISASVGHPDNKTKEPKKNTAGDALQLSEDLFEDDHHGLDFKKKNNKQNDK